MKKKITLITSILLILAITVTFVGCNKDKTEETPTTEASKVSTTEPTTKFEAPEIKDEPTTEEATEETTEETTKASYNYNSGSSNSGSSSGSSTNSTTKKQTSTNSSGQIAGEPIGETIISAGTGEVVEIKIDDSNTGGHGSAEDYVPEEGDGVLSLE